jgi:UDP-2,4-diacetamido-2,4,6-trideoxy-beta-L-altropyranose hydrolase
MHIFFRTDASAHIGIGHVMRCLTLADQLKSSGSTCGFISRKLPKYLSDLIRKCGHEVNEFDFSSSYDSTVQPPNSSIHTGDWFTDAQQTINTINNRPVDWLIVDHYELAANWERSLRGVCRRIMVIDDLANRSHDCDLLLDQGLHQNPRDRYKHLVPEHCKLRLGPEHVLLQPAFVNSRAYPHTGKIKHVLVFFGGNDQSNQAKIAIQALKNFSNLTAKVILGINHPNKASVFAEAYGHPSISVVETCSNMAGAMAEADLGLGVCGMAAWERCAMGLPTIVCVIADNQRDDTIALHQLGAVENIGEASAVTVGNWTAAISRAIAEPTRLARMSQIALAVVDGHRKNLQSLVDDLSKYDF